MCRSKSYIKDLFLATVSFVMCCGNENLELFFGRKNLDGLRPRYALSASRMAGIKKDHVP
jgi:hypothetical protein